MDFDLFDDETRQELEEAGVQVPSSSVEQADDNSNANGTVPSLPPGGEPADPESLVAAFGHWADFGSSRGRDSSASRESSNPAEGKLGVAHPPIDVSGWSVDEIRDFYAGEMDEDWGNAEAHYGHMEQDVQERLAYEATSVHEVWQERKLQMPLVLAGLGLAEAFPMATWFLGMSQTQNENEAAFGGMFYPFIRGGGSWPRGPNPSKTGTGAGQSTATVGDDAANLSKTQTSTRVQEGTKTVGPTAKTADKWSRDPRSIQDQMALDAARQGQGNKIIDNLNDPRFKGMEKWEYKVKSANGRDSVVHYVRDPKTGKLMDFKFKKHSGDSPKPWGNDPSVPPGAF